MRTIFHLYSAEALQLTRTHADVQGCAQTYTCTHPQTNLWLLTYGPVKSQYWYFSHDKHVGHDLISLSSFNASSSFQGMGPCHDSSLTRKICKVFRKSGNYYDSIWFIFPYFPQSFYCISLSVFNTCRRLSRTCWSLCLALVWRWRLSRCEPLFSPSSPCPRSGTDYIWY